MIIFLLNRKNNIKEKTHEFFLFPLGKNYFEKYKELFKCKKLTVFEDLDPS